MTAQNIRFYDDFAEFYDLLNTGRDAEHAFYAGQLQPGDEVLEVACGSGTLTRTLVEAGASVTGVDASQGMLDIAKSRLPAVPFLRGDMRSLDLGRRFDKVFCLFNSLMHMHSDQDVIDALRCLARHCREDGLVVVDVFGLDQSYLAAETAPLVVLDLPEHDSGKHLTVFETSRFDAERSMLSILLDVKDADTGVTFKESKFSMRFFTEAELDRFFDAAGLEITQRRINYDNNSERCDFRQVVFARTKA